MKESSIKNRIIKELSKQGYIHWCPIRNRFAKSDIFTIWDGLFWKGKEIRYLQWTTVSNRASHRQKIKNFMQQNEVYMKTELWCWDDKNKKFVIEII